MGLTTAVDAARGHVALALMNFIVAPAMVVSLVPVVLVLRAACVILDLWTYRRVVRTAQWVVTMGGNDLFSTNDVVVATDWADLGFPVWDRFVCRFHMSSRDFPCMGWL